MNFQEKYLNGIDEVLTLRGMFKLDVIVEAAVARLVKRLWDYVP